MPPSGPQHYIVATAGHVDHGKSALVKALTGTDPDRLPEEKARGITIDLGFAHLQLTSSPPNSKEFSIGIIDVPGHEDFVKNMVAGVGSVDLALFVVAADDGWMPQTEEHLQILDYVGVKQAVVALTKADLRPDLAPVIGAIWQQLQGTAFAQAPIVPTSVVSGAGLGELKAALTDVLARTTPPRDIGKPRLAIDRAFSLHGIGTIVTGTVSGGGFNRGESVVVQPTAVASRIRAIQSHNRDVESVGPGSRAAFNLADVPLRTANSTSGVARGHVVTLAELGPDCDTLDVLLRRSSRLIASGSLEVHPLKDGSPVWIHHGSGVTAGSVHFLAAKQLLAGEEALAQIRFESPLFALSGDRFVVRDWSEQATVAGGLVLEAGSKRRGFRKAPQQKFLQARAAQPDNVAAALGAELERDQVKPLDMVLRQSQFSKEQIGRAIEELRASGKIVTRGEIVADSAWWNQLRQKVCSAVDTHHRAHPEQAGVPVAELRALVETESSLPRIWEAILVDLLQSGFSQTGTSLRRATHRPSLPPQLQAAGTAVRAALSRNPMDPPSRKELAATPAAQQALRFLVQTGEAVELSPEVAILGEAYARAIGIVKKELTAKATATVSELRQALGTSRRVVVPLLERLDREGVTRRQGDVRVLKK